jgi:hypothetical protein
MQVTGVSAGESALQINDLGNTSSKYHRFSDYLHLPKDSFSFSFAARNWGERFPREKTKRNFSLYI